MDVSLAVLAVGLIVFLAHLFAAVFDRLGIPDVLPLVGVGLLLGPLTEIFTPEYFGTAGNVFANIALVVILFASGLQLKFADLKQSLAGAVWLTLISFFSAVMLVALVSVMTFHLPLIAGIMLGFIVGGTSSAIVVPLVEKLDLRKETGVTLVLESTISDVLCIVGTLTVLEIAQTGEMQPGLIFGRILASFGMAVATGMVLGIVWSYILNFFHELENAILTTPAFVCVAYAITSMMGFSGPVAALSFGVAIGNVRSIRLPSLGSLLGLKSEENRQRVRKTPLGRIVLAVGNFFIHTRKEEFEPSETAQFRLLSDVRPSVLHWLDQAVIQELVFVVKTFFFVYLGICIRLSDTRILIAATLLTAWLYLLRLLVARICLGRESPRLDAVATAVMAPKGLASAVIAALPLQAGLAYGAALQNVAFGVILISTALTSLLIFAVQRGWTPPPYSLAFAGYAPDRKRKSKASGQGKVAGEKSVTVQ